VYEEFVPGLDGKMRYPQPLRVELFTKMNEWIRARAGSVPSYICMDSYDVWEQATGTTPTCHADVEDRICSSMQV